jgi:DnaK suppressor protein
MAVKKTSAKGTKAKKTVVKKAEPTKKATPAKKSVARGKPSAASRTAAAAKPASKPVSKPTAKTAAKAAASAKPAKAPASEPAVKAAAPEPSAAPAPAPAKAIIAAKPVTPISLDSDISNGADFDADDTDSQDAPSTNLLAGPRNVKPYIPKRGEQYMSKEQLEHFRQILNNWKKDLMQEVDRTMLHMKDEAANFPDPNDRATQESEFSLELRTRDRERKLIRKIDEALKRIDDGTYGYCVETGEEIGIKRLEARPVATLCVEAQERRERREKQYGDRDDRYR